MPPPTPARSPGRQTRAASRIADCGRETDSPRAVRGREARADLGSRWTWLGFRYSALTADTGCPAFTGHDNRYICQVEALVQSPLQTTKNVDVLIGGAGFAGLAL